MFEYIFLKVVDKWVSNFTFAMKLFGEASFIEVLALGSSYQIHWHYARVPILEN
jgi:hypothetical protein